MGEAIPAREVSKAEYDAWKEDFSRKRDEAKVDGSVPSEVAEELINSIPPEISAYQARLEEQWGHIYAESADTNS